MSNSTLLRDFINGFWSCFRAFSFISSKKMWSYYFIGYLFSIVFIVFLVWGGWNLISQLNSFLINLLFDEKMEDSKLKLIKTGTELVMRYILLGFIWLFIFKTSKYLILIVLSPFIAFVSEKTECLYTGMNFKFNVFREFKNMLRGILIAIRNMLIELIWIAGLGFLTLIFPPIAPVSIIILTFIGFYFYGYSMIDYVNERRNLSIKKGTKRIRIQKGRAAGLGAGFIVLSFIPFFGPVLASVNSAIGAVISDPDLKDGE